MPPYRIGRALRRATITDDLLFTVFFSFLFPPEIAAIAVFFDDAQRLPVVCHG